MFQDFKRLFLENGEIKALIGTVAVFMSWSFNGEYQALLSVSCLIGIDLLTGTYFAVRNKEWDSKKSKTGVAKVGRYLVYMLVARMVDKVTPLDFASPLMDTYIAMTEAGSILENFHKLGYPVPTILLNKLKTFHDNKG